MVIIDVDYVSCCMQKTIFLEKCYFRGLTGKAFFSKIEIIKEGKSYFDEGRRDFPTTIRERIELGRFI